MFKKKTIDRKSSKDDISSPKHGARFQATNVIRQHISNSSTSQNQTAQKPLTLNTANLSSVNQSIHFELGKEPDVHSDISNLNKQENFPSKASLPNSSPSGHQSSAKSSSQNNKVTAGLSQAFVSRLAGTLAGRNKSPKLDNEYAEIPSYAQVKKTPRKPKKQAPIPDGLY